MNRKRGASFFVSAAAAAAAAVLASCARPPGGDSATTAASSDACSAAKLGLGPVTAGAPWKPPAGCELNGDPGGPAVLVTSDAEWKARFTCSGSGAHGIDFTRQALVAQRRTLSPAGMGTSVFDDGKTITLVGRFRSPCPGEPMAMPMPITVAALVPAGGAREFKETVCNVDWKCR
jgi:hypothetical protein